MNLKYENKISCKDYIRLRDEVGWDTLPEEQAEAGLNNSAYVIACKDEEYVVASARVIWDGGYVAYICDVMVSPEYQGKGIGSEMIKKIMNYLENQLKSGWKIMIVLGAAEGKELFYEKFGFEKRPNEHLGAGMSQWISN